MLVPARCAARVARYAWSDVYGELHGALAAGAARLRSAGYRARRRADDNALVDRAAAHRAGLGWYGKNANLLLPGPRQLVRARLGASPTRRSPRRRAGGRRLRLVHPLPRLRARPAPSWRPGWSTPAAAWPGWCRPRGSFPVEHRVALGDRLYGCDDCQEVCPPEPRAARRADVDARQPRRGRGRPGDWVDVLEVLAADDAELLAAVGRWYIPDASRATCAATR